MINEFISRPEFHELLALHGYNDPKYRLQSSGKDRNPAFQFELDGILTKEFFDSIMGKGGTVADCHRAINGRFTYITILNYARKFGYDSSDRATAGKKSHIQGAITNMERYGVTNVSSLESNKKAKSEKYLAKAGEEQDEINRKRIITCQETYGVTNVSKLDDVKEKKLLTFTEHFGESNIFKRSDLMKKYWVASLGVENPKFDSEINIKRALSSIHGLINEQGFRKYIGSKEFGFLSDAEYYYAKMLSKHIKINRMCTNDFAIEKVIDCKSVVVIPDITIDKNIFIEVKSSDDVFNRKIMDHILNIADLKDGQAYLFIVNWLIDWIFIVCDTKGVKMYHTFKEKKMPNFMNDFTDLTLIENDLDVISSLFKATLDKYEVKKKEYPKPTIASKPLKDDELPVFDFD